MLLVEFLAVNFAPFRPKNNSPPTLVGGQAPEPGDDNKFDCLGRGAVQGGEIEPFVVAEKKL